MLIATSAAVAHNDFHYSKATVAANPIGAGTVYVSKTDGDFSEEKKEEKQTCDKNSDTHTYYFQATTNTGYKWKGWYDDSDTKITEGTSVSDGKQRLTYSFDATSTTEGSPTTKNITAKWDPKTYTITLDNQGATNDASATQEITATYNSSAGLSISVLPTKTDSLFDGYFTQRNGAGTKVINNAGSVLSPYVDGEGKWIKDTTEKFTLYADWVSKRTPDVSCSIEDAYEVEDEDLDLSDLWTRTGSSGAVTYSIASFEPDVADEEGATEPAIDEEDGHTLSLGQAGELTLQMYIAEAGEYKDSTVTKVVRINKRENAITCSWGSWSKNVGFDSETGVTFSSNNDTGTGIVVTPASGSANATYDGTNTKIVASHNIGSATWSVSQAADYKYQAATTQTLTVNVNKATSPNDKVVKLYNKNDNEEKTCDGFGENPTMWAHAGLAAKLYFEAKRSDGSDHIYPYEYADGKWTSKDGWDIGSSLKSDYKTFDKDLSANATGVKFTGNESKIKVRNVYVTSNNTSFLYIDTIGGSSFSTLRMPVNQIGGHETKAKFLVDYGTCDDYIKLVSSNSNITFKATGTTTYSYAVHADRHSRDTIELIYTSPEMVEDITATITVYTAYEHETLTVKAKSNEYLSTTLEYIGAASYSVTADDIDATDLFRVRDENGDLVASPVITLTSSDYSKIDTVKGDKAIDFLCGGSTTITASYTGDSKYAAASNLAQSITVNKLEDAITWNASVLSDTLYVYADRSISSSIATANTTATKKISYTSRKPLKLTVTPGETSDVLYAAAHDTVRLVAQTTADCTYSSVKDSIVVIIMPCDQRIVWNQRFMGMSTKEDGTIDTTIVLNAYAVDSMGQVTGKKITYRLVDAGDAAEILNENELHITGTCDAEVQASTAEDAKYEVATSTRALRVRSYGEACDSEFAETNRHEFSYYTNRSGLSYDIPPSDTMYIKIGRKSAITCAYFSIFAYDEKGNQTEIVKMNPDTLSNGGKNYTILMDPKYRRLKVQATGRTGIDTAPGDGGTEYKWFSDMHVKQKTYMEASVSSISDLTLQVYDSIRDTILLSYSDKPLIQYSYSGDYLTLTPTHPIENDCGDFGVDTFVLSGCYPKAGTYEKHIYFTTTAGDEIDIPVTHTVSPSEEITFNTAGEWSTGSNWSGSSTPTNTSAVTITKNVTITGHAQAYSVSVDNGVTITIAPTGGLTVGAGGITGEGKDNITLKADADTKNETLGQTGYLRVSPDFSGDMQSTNVELYSIAYADNESRTATWQYVGVPVAGTFHGWNLCTYGDQFIYGWNETTGSWFNAFESVIDPFKGYSFTQNKVSEGDTFTFTGTLQAPRTVNIPLSNTADKGGGNNVLANSFTAPIDISRFEAADFIHATATIYLFNTGSYNKDGYTIVDVEDAEDATAGQYIAIPVATANAILNEVATFPVMIPAMQGFCVKADRDDAELKLDYRKLIWEANYGTHSNNPLRAPRREAKSETNTSGFMKITMRSGEAADVLYLLESNDYEKAYENGYDAPKMMSDDESLANIFAVEGENQLAIDATSDFEQTFIGVRTGSATNYTLHFSHVNGEEEWMLYDVLTNKKTPIEEGASYSFVEATNSIVTSRFVIIANDGSATQEIATGVDGIGTETKVQKFLYNDQLMILKDGVLYNAQGVLVERKQ